MRYQPHIRCNIAYTPWPLAYCPPPPLLTSTTLHLLSVSLSHFQRTRTQAISFSFRIVGQSFQPLTRKNTNQSHELIFFNPTYGWLACYFRCIRTRTPNGRFGGWQVIQPLISILFIQAVLLLLTFGFLWSNQDLYLTCKGHAQSFTDTMLTPYNWHYRSSHALVVHPSLPSQELLA